MKATTMSKTDKRGMHKHAISGVAPKSPKFRHNARLQAEGTAAKSQPPPSRPSAQVRREKWQQKRKKRT